LILRRGSLSSVFAAVNRSGLRNAGRGWDWGEAACRIGPGMFFTDNAFFRFLYRNLERTEMQPAEIIHVETATVGCDGGGGPLGHPLVYLAIGHSGETDCPYCGRHYILDHTAKVHDHA
jgi:uncharacterized Zn-finger protein